MFSCGDHVEGTLHRHGFASKVVGPELIGHPGLPQGDLDHTVFLPRALTVGFTLSDVQQSQ